MSDAAAAPKKSKKGLFLILLVVLLGGGGGGAYFFYFKAPAAQAASGEEDEHAEEAPEEEEEEAPKKAKGTGVVPMEPFVVNLADAGATRFLRVNLGLVVADEEIAKEIEDSAVEMARIRSAILELLAQQHADTLVTPEGKDELKKHIAERVKHAVNHAKVFDVLFSEFVVQF